MSSLDQAIAQMRADGMPEFPPGHPKLDAGKITRYGPKGRAWYRLWLVQSRGGTDVVVGAYGDWRTGLKAKIEVDWKGISAEERAELEARMREQEAREREKRADRAGKAANRARMQWADALTIEQAYARSGGRPPSEYLDRKGVVPEGCRFFSDGTVLVPAMLFDDADGSRMVGVQKIAPSGEKRFNAGMSKEGACCRLGAPPRDGDVILVCEGYATALSIRMATEQMLPVFSVFDAGNLRPVAEILRARYPASPLIFCADDDWKTEIPKGVPFNTGRVKAHGAARAVGNAWVIVPLFHSKGREDAWSDFNDLHKAHGLEAVRDQLRIVEIMRDMPPIEREGEPLPAAGDKGEDARGDAPVPAEDPSPDAAAAPGGGGGRRKKPPSTANGPHGDDEPFAWLPPGQWLHRKKGAGFLGDVHNAFLFLAFHPDWEGVLAYDLFGEIVTKLKAPPYEGGEPGEWKDLDDARALLWLSGHIAEPAEKAVRNAVMLASHRHEFNKVRDYLEACAERWDGMRRLQTWLIEYLGVCRGPEMGALPAEERDRVLQYVELAGMKWLIAGAARALRPGCRVDTMLILEGEQGTQKSTALRTLFGEWFTDARLDFANKDTLLILQGRWGVEMPELEGMNKADTSETKRFLTQHEDYFRPPYGQKLVKAPRRCIFAGTVNHDAYLKDDSGNRRFWPVRCSGVIDLDRLVADRDQLWGEAVRFYRAGVPWWVTPDERSLFEEQQDLRYQTDAWEARVVRFLDGDGGLRSRRDDVTTDEILGEGLGIEPGRWDRNSMIRVGSIMRRLGWPRSRRGQRASREWFYSRPKPPAGENRKPAPAPVGGDDEPF